MHQPVQIYEPHLNSRFCADPELARQSRQAVLEQCACSNGLLLPAHFGRPHVGRVSERAGGFAFSCDKRSEEHTSELQSLMRNSYAVFCLKKKKNLNSRL